MIALVALFCKRVANKHTFKGSWVKILSWWACICTKAMPLKIFEKVDRNH